MENSKWVKNNSTYQVNKSPGKVFTGGLWFYIEIQKIRYNCCPQAKNERVKKYVVGRFYAYPQKTNDIPDYKIKDRHNL